MSSHREEIPLFPLHAVVFPHARIQLHIFEDRYREMVRFCEEFDVPFGIVLIRAGQENNPKPEPFLVGTTVRIEKIHRYPDGRMHLSAIGERRFRIRKLDETRPYLVGITEPLSESEPAMEPNRLDALSMRAIEAFKILIRGMIARPDFNVDVQVPEDIGAMSFVIANFLDLENPQKQHLLELTDAGERLATLIPLIEKQIIEADTGVYRRLQLDQVRDWISPN